MAKCDSFQKFKSTVVYLNILNSDASQENTVVENSGWSCLHAAAILSGTVLGHSGYHALL